MRYLQTENERYYLIKISVYLLRRFVEHSFVVEHICVSRSKMANIGSFCSKQPPSNPIFMIQPKMCSECQPSTPTGPSHQDCQSKIILLQTTSQQPNHAQNVQWMPTSISNRARKQQDSQHWLILLETTSQKPNYAWFSPKCAQNANYPLQQGEEAPRLPK